MNIKLYSKDNINEFITKETEDSIYAKEYLLPLIEKGIENYISNVKTELSILCVDDLTLPITINYNEDYNNSYVVSPYIHYIKYLKEELYHINNKFLRRLLQVLVFGLDKLSIYSKINKIVFVNNWFLSTNLYTQITEEQIIEITSFLKDKFPEHSIAFRSINNYQSNSLMNSLKKGNYLLIPSRQIYFSKKLEELHSKYKKQLQKDKRLIKEKGYEIKELKQVDSKIIKRFVELYNLLYIERYSEYNPKFTEEFIKLGIQKNLFTFLYFEKDNKVNAFLGYFHREGVMTTPLVGYDTQLPKEEGLYRLLTTTLNDESEKRNFLLHRSSGAANFKRNRGAVPILEYTAVNVSHLSFRRKLIWIVLQLLLNKIAVPIIERYKL